MCSQATTGIGRSPFSDLSFAKIFKAFPGKAKQDVFNITQKHHLAFKIHNETRAVRVLHILKYCLFVEFLKTKKVK